MEEKRETEGKERLVLEGNSFYEIDLECMHKKEKERSERGKGRQGKRQRS